MNTCVLFIHWIFGRLVASGREIFISDRSVKLPNKRLNMNQKLVQWGIFTCGQCIMLRLPSILFNLIQLLGTNCESETMNLPPKTFTEPPNMEPLGFDILCKHLISQHKISRKFRAKWMYLAIIPLHWLFLCHTCAYTLSILLN